MIHRDEYMVDVIVPIYNKEKYIEKCINSILDQTYKGINIILVDDGSTDHSGAICDDYAAKYMNIRVIHQKNKGLVSAWKTGIKNSSEEWIVFVDADDWIEERHIEVMVGDQLQNNADIVIGPMKQMKGNNTYQYDFGIPMGSYSGDSLEQNLYPHMFNTAGYEKQGVPTSRFGKLIRKMLIDNNMRYCKNSISFEEDLCITFVSELDANIISFVEGRQAAYCYRIEPNSMLHGYNSNMRVSIQGVFEGIYQACIDKGKLFFIPQIRTAYLYAKVREASNELKGSDGYKTAVSNVRKISKDVNLQDIIAKSDLAIFPARFRLMIKVFKNIEKPSSKVILALIYVAVRIRR